MRILGLLMMVLPAACLALLTWRRYRAGAGATLDMSAIALAAVLNRLNDAISELESGAAADDAALRDSVVVMVRSARSAYADSLRWRRKRGLPADDGVTVGLGDALLDSLRFIAVGSDRWLQLKAQLDLFHSVLAADQKSTEPPAATPAPNTAA